MSKLHKYMLVQSVLCICHIDMQVAEVSTFGSLLIRVRLFTVEDVITSYS